MMLPNTIPEEIPFMTTMLRVTLPLAYALLMIGCQNTPARGPIINSGSYDWTDDVRDARGFPVPGWGSAMFGPR